MTISISIDHIIYTTPKLEDGIETIANLLGERPYFGGQHPNKGSHNALLSLGEEIYLEIIAPDPEQPNPPVARSFGLDHIQEARLATWSARPDDLETTVATARAVGFDPGKTVNGGRKRSDGLDLKWRSTKQLAALAGETPVGDWLIPFLIDWGNTPHPAQSQRGACQLIQLELQHPDPALIRSTLDALGFGNDIIITAGETTVLAATIDSPNGRVILR